MFSQITPLILTFNEEANLPRTLHGLSWASRIVVVDSFSTDQTCDIVRNRAGALLVQRAFDSFAQQCNFGLQHIQTPWVLSLDADYVLSAELIDEIRNLVPPPQVAGYSIAFKYCVQGYPLRASLYPPRISLYRKPAAHYRDEGHGHRVEIQGDVATLRSPIYHDDRKRLDRWLQEQNRYMDIEAQTLHQGAGNTLNRADRIRKAIVFSPALVFFYCLLAKGLLWDGWPGWCYVMQRTLAEAILSYKLAELKLKPRKAESVTPNSNQVTPT